MDTRVCEHAQLGHLVLVLGALRQTLPQLRGHGLGARAGGKLGDVGPPMGAGRDPIVAAVEKQQAQFIAQALLLEVGEGGVL